LHIAEKSLLRELQRPTMHQGKKTLRSVFACSVSMRGSLWMHHCLLFISIMPQRRQQLLHQKKSIWAFFCSNATNMSVASSGLCDSSNVPQVDCFVAIIADSPAMHLACVTIDSSLQNDDFLPRLPRTFCVIFEGGTKNHNDPF